MKGSFAIVCGLAKNFFFSIGVKRIKPMEQIGFFNISMVKKQGFTAIILTPGAVEIIAFGNYVPGFIHGVVKGCNRFKYFICHGCLNQIRGLGRIILEYRFMAYRSVMLAIKSQTDRLRGFFEESQGAISIFASSFCRASGSFKK